MALALYRKYRPRTFAEVIGQEHVTEPLSQALRSGRLHHAYLFSGPRGCGKTSSARILARSLNCEQGPTPEPCGVCLSCRSLANDGTGSIDVLEIDAASHGGVDDARELREKAFFAPASSRFKIYVIDEAHMVSSAGFNALLKLVEEPPDYVKFIFATTEPDKVLGTIRSRTHHYPFRLIPPATLRPYLQQLTEAEGVTVEPAVFPLVVKAGGGSARDSLSVLDQLIAGAGPDGVSYARAIALLGVTDAALIDEMCDALAAGDGAAAYATIDRVAEAGHDPRRFASDLLERLRDLIVLQQVPDAVAKGLIDGPTDQLEAMSAQATRLGPATLSRAADIVHNGLVEMRGTTAPRLLLELVTARMLLPGAEDSTGALLQRLERMERRLSLSGEPTPLAVRGEPDPVPSQTAPGPAPIEGAPAAPAGGRAGLSAARAAAAAAAAGRRVSAAATAARPATADAPTATPAPSVIVPVRAEAAGRSVGNSAQADSSAGSDEPGAGRPVGADQAPEAAGSDAAGSAAGQPDWNRVADGVGPVSGATGHSPADTAAQVAQPNPAAQVAQPNTSARVAQPASADLSAQSSGVATGQSSGGSVADPEFYDDEPPWDDEPEPEPYPPAAEQPALVTEVTRASSPVQAVDGGSPAPQAQPVPVSPPEPALAPRVEPGSALRGEPGSSSRAEQESAPRREPAGLLPDAPEEPGEAAVAAAIPGQLDVTAVREVWPEIITVIGRQSKKIAALASGATVRDFDGQTVVLTFRFPAHARMVAPEATMISNALYEALGGRWNIRCDVAGEGDAMPPAPPSPGRLPRGAPAGSAPTSGAPAGAASAGGAPSGGAPAGSVPPGGASAGGVPTGGAPAGGALSGGAPAGGVPSGGALTGEGSAGAGTVSGDSVGDGSAAAGRDAAPDQSPRNAPTQGAGSRPAQVTAVSPQTPATRSSARAPQNRRPGAETPASSDGDDDWPEPARPGGLAAAAAGPPISASVEEDWPEVRVAGSGNPVSSAGPADGDHGNGVAASAVDSAAGRRGDDHGAPSRTEAGDPSVSSDPGGTPLDGAAGAGTAFGGSDRGLGVAGRGADAVPEGGEASSAVVGAGSGDSSGNGPAVGDDPATGGIAGSDAGAALEQPGANAAAGAGAPRTGNGPRNAGPLSGLAAARAAAAGGRNAVSRQGAKPGGGWADGSPTEEAPYDPEFDGAPPGESAAKGGTAASGGAVSSYEGFDPGDEPLDEVIDEKTARESSEQQAMRLLKEAFGAEKIGES
ncbi:DNA polymerase III subunit gamma and tau [Micromonosporaceae bacterium Da 78-11]